MSYTEAEEKYAALGVDTEAALTKLKTVSVSRTADRGTMCAASTPTPPSP